MLQQLIGREGFFFLFSRCCCIDSADERAKPNYRTGEVKKKKREKNEKVKKRITASSFGECTKARAQPDYGHYVVFFQLVELREKDFDTIMRLGSITPVTEWNQKKMVTFSSLAVVYGQHRRI